MTTQPNDGPLLGTAEMNRTFLCLVMNRNAAISLAMRLAGGTPSLPHNTFQSGHLTPGAFHTVGPSHEGVDLHKHWTLPVFNGHFETSFVPDRGGF